MFQSLFPTFQARKKAKSAGLLAAKCPNHKNERLITLRDFQLMSIYGTFDDALINFYGENLSEKQIEVLQTIYDETKIFVIKCISTALFEKSFPPKIRKKLEKIL